MGCGASIPASAVPRSVDDALADALVGQKVHVLGIVAHEGTVLHSPFAEDTGVAMTVSWHMSGSQTNSNRHFFTAEDMISFKVVSGNKEIRVVAGPRWNLAALKETHTAWNIMLDGDGMVSGGTGHGQFSKVAPRPHAMPFFKAFNKNDMVRTIQTTNDHGCRQARCRKAIESVLRVGDRVAVFGTLREGADQSLRLESGEGGIIANQSINKSVSVSAPERTPSAEPAVVYMKPGRTGDVQ